MSQPIVSIAGVTKTFGPFTALHETNLQLNAGEFVTLLGPSGCGKTTTLRLIGGFELATTGSIAIEGRDVTSLPPYRRPVNTVFQDYALFPHMSVEENVAYGLTAGSSVVPKADREARVRDALGLVGLTSYGSRLPGALSGGQRQRVAMARAIVKRPRVLLLDEPLSALDVKLRETMQIELKRLHRELGITFLMVTHDQGEALALSDRIVVMSQGRVVQVGAPTDLYDRPCSAYIADFIGASNLLDATFEAASGGVDVFQLSDGTRIHKARRDGESIQKLQIGSRVQLGIRPEHVHLSPIIDGNEIEARLAGNLFLGDRLRLELFPARSDRPFFVDLHRDESSRRAPELGEKVKLYVGAADIMCFAEAER
ncbi:spermidine/putrescine ABC transporter ATPase [Aureimonas ureilytica]|uniref:Spermidine/putrescine ABC transporter ATPase n=1 Tax=Aureimonas ureilytica TaxID=401562 RepID=A0A175R622_9HYPH|nr:ABC transporter ATP-binding protein [Aureimonas ureilytica]KTQ94174.1 spermidine/putrescine ABC transporter ATPase [Aureimonas ureilytica]KTR07028.1 spermidine/putrescine ABC transporter ATPase [Aureimonas ureilytica]